MSKGSSSYYEWPRELLKHEIHYLLEGGQAMQRAVTDGTDGQSHRDQKGIK
jgi:hypothetical protein